MSQPSLEDISQAQRERLFHIDFKLRFLGAINRNDLVNRFGIKAAAATRDLSIYREIAPKNLNYDTKAKSYTQSRRFKPLFEYKSSQALSALCHGLGDDHVSVNNALVSAETPIQVSFPNLDTLATITKAIHQKKALKIEYYSLSRGLEIKEIVPFALIDNGLCWHIRAYDRSLEKFTDFVINRITKPKLLEENFSMQEIREADIQWNRIVEMHIVPHPNLKYPKAVEMEYGMEQGLLTLQVRAALTGYLLQRWNIDCSKQHELKEANIHLWLRNQQTLYGVENLDFAPGYEPTSAQLTDD